MGGLLTLGIGDAIGSIFGAIGSNNAASKEQAAAQKAIGTTTAATQAQQGANTTAVQGQQFSNDALTNTENSSYNLTQASGQNAQTQLNTLLQSPNQGFQFNVANDPGYAFNLQQGQEALKAQAAATGDANSGGTLKALTQYSQNYASNQYQNAFSNYQTQLQNLFNQTGLGLQANNAVSANTNTNASLNTGLAETGVNANTGLTTSQNADTSQLITGAGQAGAAGTLGVTNSLASGINNTANQAFLQQLLNQNGGTGPTVNGNDMNNQSTTNPGSANYQSLMGS